ncbi:cation:proton antiporter [Synechococcus elongatus]|uniref:Cation:proton antiporter n=1 Tax=Synechococcus elongatus PCC 11802 TaxID=2283154 RepID=A0AAT9JXV1_SYNEL|nr:sodium:proton antiporter [Synechococcus elongatus]QFZ93081.1 sodium:proton antiporter [Synechococcus elongatus PCC 11802]
MSLEVLATEPALEYGLERFFLALVVALSVATLPQVFSWFRQIPYTLLLVIAGLGLALFNVRLINLSPELILSIFLPPLLFEAAWNLKWSNLKKDWIPISLYAVIGVGISILGIAFGLSQTTSVPIVIALLIGASLATTDPVSVIAMFRELGVAERTRTLVEGESLFNDGVAVVTLSLLLSLPLEVQGLEAQSLLADLIRYLGIGIGSGCLIGFGVSFLTQRLDLPLLEQSLTLVSAYGSYLLSEQLGGSGVIAVVPVGLILGNFGSRIGMSPRTRVIVTEFWEFLAFFVNSIVFLLIGDQVPLESLWQNRGAIAITVVAMLAARAIATFGLGWLSNRLSRSDLSWRELIVVWWGGIRGAVSIALALSIPTVLLQRDLITATVFGSVLFTLLVQGLTMKPLLGALGLLGDQALRQQYAEVIARQTALKRVLQRLQQTEPQAEIDPAFCREQVQLIEAKLQSLTQELAELCDRQPELQHYALESLQAELLAIEADTYAEFVRSGQLSQELSPILRETLAFPTQPPAIAD